jgi:phosphoglycerol transferase MdoB-like AlkP superfamily enzyme
MDLSRLPYAPKLSLTLNHKSIFKAFKEQLKGETLFLRGVSKFYGGENILLRDLFGVDKLITKEELEKYLPPISVDSWGYHNLTVYNELVKLLKNRNQSQPILAMVKTIDLHQPPYYCGLPKKDLPDSVRNHPSPIIPSIYWIDYCLKSLFENLKKNKLLTDKTLVVITSDHHPLPGWGHKELVKSKLPVHRERLPLIFVSKNLKPFKNFNSNKLSCQLDLAPTLCELAGLKVPETFMGQSIISGFQTGRALSMHQKSMFVEREEKQEATIISIPPAKEQRSSIKKWFNNLF